MSIENPQSGMVRREESGLVEEDVKVVEGEVVDEQQPKIESGEGMKVNKQEVLMKVEQTIPAGEHLICDTLMKSKIIVSPGAKLTVVEVAMKNNIVVQKGGSVEILGTNMQSEIIRE